MPCGRSLRDRPLRVGPQQRERVDQDGTAGDNKRALAAHGADERWREQRSCDDPPSEAGIARASERDEAEGMPGRVTEHPEGLPPTGEPPRAQREHVLLGLIELAHPHVNVQLLRMIWVGPLRRAQVRDPLEGNARPVRRIADHHPVDLVLDPLHAQEFLIELRELAGVRAVNDKAVPASDHAASMPGASDRSARRREPLPASQGPRFRGNVSGPDA